MAGFNRRGRPSVAVNGTASASIVLPIEDYDYHYRAAKIVRKPLSAYLREKLSCHRSMTSLKAYAVNLLDDLLESLSAEWRKTANPGDELNWPWPEETYSEPQFSITIADHRGGYPYNNKHFTFYKMRFNDTDYWSISTIRDETSEEPFNSRQRLNELKSELDALPFMSIDPEWSKPH